MCEVTDVFIFGVKDQSGWRVVQVKLEVGEIQRV